MPSTHVHPGSDNPSDSSASCRSRPDLATVLSATDRVARERRADVLNADMGVATGHPVGQARSERPSTAVTNGPAIVVSACGRASQRRAIRRLAYTEVV